MLAKQQVKAIAILVVSVVLFALALRGMVQTLLSLRFTMEMTREGVQTLGAVTSKRESDHSIFYVYSADGREFGGYYQISSEDSDFGFTEVGDKVNVVYSARRPYVSTAGLKAGFSSRGDQILAIFWGLTVLGSLWLARIGIRAKKDVLQSTTTKPTGAD